MAVRSLHTELWVLPADRLGLSGVLAAVVTVGIPAIRSVSHGGTALGFIGGVSSPGGTCRERRRARGRKTKDMRPP